MNALSIIALILLLPFAILPLCIVFIQYKCWKEKPDIFMVCASITMLAIYAYCVWEQYTIGDML
jgi:hypothetical protein